MGSLKKGLDRARAQGIPVQDVVNSYATHLTAERRKLRDNPRALEALAPAKSYSLAVTQTNTATGIRWRSMNLPAELGELSVTGSSWDAARNKMNLVQLMEQRYRVEFASALQRAGVYPATLEGRRAAMAVAIESKISVVDLVELGRA